MKWSEIALGACLGWLAGFLLSTDTWAGDDAPGSSPADIEVGFRSPPDSARPRVWWHWMNGNVTLEGIDKDLDWMARVGIGGLQNFDANLTTPQIVEERLVYMEPDWKKAFRHAVERAEALGLEFAIAASPGWSETGGPWVLPENGMKKLVWGETVLAGGQRFNGRLTGPPVTTGPYQDVAFGVVFSEGEGATVPAAHGDIVTLAVPVMYSPLPAPAATGADGKAVETDPLTDSSMETDVRLPISVEQPAELVYEFPSPVTVRSSRVFVHDAQPPFAPPRYSAVLESENDGEWTKITDVRLADAAATASFAPVTASRFRLKLSTPPPPPANFLGSVPGAVVGRLFPEQGQAEVRIGDFHLFSEPRVPQSELKAGFGTVPNYYDIAGSSVDTGPAAGEVIDLSGRVGPDGSLDWTPPEGSDWKVLRFGWSLTGKTNHPATAEATGLEVDKYDSAAVRDYLEHYLGMYQDTVGADLIGKAGIRAILTDSIEVGASNWTPTLLAEFKSRRGYDAVPWLPTVAGVLIGSTAESNRFLFDFRRTLGELMSEGHYGTVARVAHERGLKVYGEAHEGGRPVLADDLAMRRYADFPMAAMWTHDRERGPRWSLVGDIRGAASVSHFYGQNIVAAESLTSAFSPWAFSPADLRPIIDLEFAHGVNRPVIHTSVHQPVDDRIPGLSLAIFGQYFNRHETWAEMAGPWVDYLTRSAYLLQYGRNVADIAWFYGEDTPVTAAYSRGIPAGMPTHRGFDFLNSEMLAALEVEDRGALVSPGGARYRVLVLGGTSDNMTVPVLRKLLSLVEQGATVIGAPPDESPSLADSQQEFASLVEQIWSHSNVIESDDIEGAMIALGIGPDWQVENPDGAADLMFVHRAGADTDLYFVSNRLDEATKADVRFRVSGKSPELWDAVTGTSRPLNYRFDDQGTVVSLDLAAEQSAFVVFRQPTTVAVRNETPLPLQEIATITTPWTVRFQAGRGAPASIEMPQLRPLDTVADPGIRYFSGIATYQTQVDVPGEAQGKKEVWLELGKVGDVAEVLVNGKPAGIVWLAPNRVEIGSLLQPGSNALEVRVANLWVNRLIGDQQPEADKITWTAVPTYHADAPLRPSGLIGPVRLLARDR